MDDLPVAERSGRRPAIENTSADSANSCLLFSLVASGQIKLRKIDGWRKIAAVLSPHRPEERVLFARIWKPRLVGVGG